MVETVPVFEIIQRVFDDRHSCRAFLPEPIDHTTILDILRTAQRTASWCNAQPWQVIVTGLAATDRLRHALQAAAGRPAAPDIDFPDRYEGAYLDRRRACGLDLYASVGIARGDRAASAAQAARNFALFDAPHAAIVTAPAALGAYGAIDCGAYVANFMTVATSLGVATIAQAALASRADVIRSVFELPADRRVVCGIAFGRADPNHPANRFRTGRATVAEAATIVLD